MSKQGTEAPDQPMPEKALKELFGQSHDRGRAGLPVMSLSVGRGLVPKNQDERRVETNLSDEQHRLVRAGELAYNMMRMWQGVCGLAEEDCLISPAYVVVRPLNGMDPKFSEYLLTYEETVAQFKLLSFGVVDDRLRLYFKDFERVRVRIPSPQAQRKIARILTMLDNLIHKTEALITKYQAIKQGMMHGLFTRGVDAHGHLRPPQSEAPDLYKQSELGSIPREWEVAPLGDCLASIDAGWSSDCIEQPPPLGEWGVLKVSAITSGEYMAEESKTLPGHLHPYPSMEVRAGDVLLARSNGVAELVGVTAQVDETRDKLVLSDKVLRLNPVTERLHSSFLALTMKTYYTRKQVGQVISGSSGQRNISQAEIRNLLVVIPPLEEQECISSVLHSAQSQLHREMKVVAQLKQIKAGL